MSPCTYDVRVAVWLLDVGRTSRWLAWFRRRDTREPTDQTTNNTTHDTNQAMITLVQSLAACCCCCWCCCFVEGNAKSQEAKDKTTQTNKTKIKNRCVVRVGGHAPDVQLLSIYIIPLLSGKRREERGRTDITVANSLRRCNCGAGCGRAGGRSFVRSFVQI